LVRVAPTESHAWIVVLSWVWVNVDDNVVAFVVDIGGRGPFLRRRLSCMRRSVSTAIELEVLERVVVLEEAAEAIAAHGHAGLVVQDVRQATGAARAGPARCSTAKTSGHSQWTWPVKGAT